MARGKRDLCGVGLDEREGDAEPVLAAPGRLELSRSHVHPNRPGAALGQPGGEVRRPAAELDDIQAADVTEHAELLLGHVENTPGDVLGPQARKACSSPYSLFARVHSSRLAATPSAPGPGLSHPAPPPRVPGDMPMPR